MKVSLNHIRRFIDFDLPPIDELVDRINSQLGAVEEVIDLNAKYKDAKIVRVVECEKHPDADKLSLCKIDAGTGEIIEVVCGASNVHSGMWAVWLPPGSIVPSTFFDPTPFVLSVREIRGTLSNGMLASAKELAIGDDHDGIVELQPGDVLGKKAIAAGDSFAEIFGLNDTVIDIENKMFTHRPDLFGQLGVAREISGIYEKRFTSPEWYLGYPNFQAEAEPVHIHIFNDVPELSERFMAVVLEDIVVKPSPMWLQCALVAMGSKPINNIVDATNYVMLVTSQPTHAYDLDKIRGGQIGVRRAGEGEQITLINGKSYELSSDDIVVADAERPIGLAGIMGGKESEVSESTRRIVLEVANFGMYAVRKSSMRHGLFTDAVSRFNKGQSPFQNSAVLAHLMEIIGARQASAVYDVNNTEKSVDIQITDTFINRRLGLQLQNEDIKKLLGNVEILVDESKDKSGHLNITAPFWRTDLQLPEDIVEEAGRLHGYDRLPLEMPMRVMKPARINELRQFKQEIREILSRAGANETISYSFVHENLLVKTHQDKSDAYRLSNALSPDLQYYRLSLTPSLLDRIHLNHKAGYEEFALFEIGKAHSKSKGVDEEDLPIESSSIAFVYSSVLPVGGAPYFQAANYVRFLGRQLNINLKFEPLGAHSTSPVVAPFEPKRSAIITSADTGEYFGVVGEYDRSVSSSFKLPDQCAGFELDVAALLRSVSPNRNTYRPLSRFPSVTRDMSLRVASELSYNEVYTAMENILSTNPILHSIVPIAIYHPEDTGWKTFTFRLTFVSNEKTLTSNEANEVIESAARALKQSIGAALV